MFNILKLALPAIIPSWNFFDIIAPSPRIEFACWDIDEKPVQDWQEMRPRPQSISISTMIGRLLWNPQWNENLYLVSLAERHAANPTFHSEGEIIQRIQNDLIEGGQKGNQICLVQFRLMFVKREQNQVVREQHFISEKHKVLLGDADVD